MMSALLPPVSIIGAGLSGLTLAQCLKKKGIAAVIYDRARSVPSYNYGITLHHSTYKSLLNLLDLDEPAFRKCLVVDRQQEGSGRSIGSDKSFTPRSLRCNRGRLEALLRDTLSIEWERRLNGIQFSAQSEGITATFDNGHSANTSCIIGCDGPHSMVRQSLCSGMKLEVLPFVVFKGTRRISNAEYADKFRSHMGEDAVMQTRVGESLLQISVSDLNSSEVTLGYTYSRLAKATGDPLHRPNRPIAGAEDIPDEFFSELETLESIKEPFQEIFNAKKVRNDKLMHWLMRTLLPEPDEVKQLAARNVVLLGDAVHATPILGGNGANLAIKDAMDLGDHIASHGLGAFEGFSAARMHGWIDAVNESKRKIQEIHLSRSVNL